MSLKRTTIYYPYPPYPLSLGKGEKTGTGVPATRLGATPKARTLWLLAKSFARCKTSRASNTRHPIFDKQEVYRQNESCGSFIAATAFQTVEKVCFSKKVLVLYPYKNALWALRPAKPLGVLSRHPCRNPKPLPRGEGLCMLGWLCIVQSLLAYTPGIRAGAEWGAAALTPLGATPQTPYY